MYYIQLNVSLSHNQEWKEESYWIADVFKDSLIAIGFDSFVDTESGFEAYCSEEKYSFEKVKEVAEESLGFVDNLEISYLEEKIEQKDWNAEWEKDYPSVRFGEFCVVVQIYRCNRCTRKIQLHQLSIVAQIKRCYRCICAV